MLLRPSRTFLDGSWVNIWKSKTNNNFVNIVSKPFVYTQEILLCMHKRSYAIILSYYSIVVLLYYYIVVLLYYYYNIIQCAARNPATVPFRWLHDLRSVAFLDHFCNGVFQILGGNSHHLRSFWKPGVLCGTNRCKKGCWKNGAAQHFLLQRSVLCGSRCLWFLSELAAQQSCGQALCEGMCVKKCGIFGRFCNGIFLDVGR